MMVVLLPVAAVVEAVVVMVLPSWLVIAHADFTYTPRPHIRCHSRPVRAILRQPWIGMLVW
jgi:hypothetical protein